MHLAIDALGVAFGGGQTYRDGLLSGLMNVPDIRFTVFSPVGLDSVPDVRVVSFGRLAVVRRIGFQLGRLGELAERCGADVLVSLTDIAPRRISIPTVVVIQNPNPWGRTYPTLSSAAVRLSVLRRLSAGAMRRASRVVFLSEQSRDSIAPRVGVRLDRTAVVRHGLDEALFRADPSPADEAIAARYAFGRPYVLTVSTLYRVKNFVRLIEAFAESGLRDAYALVIAGRSHEPDVRAEIESTARRLGVFDRVRLVGEVPHGDLPALYRRAAAFIFPSYSETFGLPPLEAMACGAPVAAARASSIPEVCGDAALYFDPFDVRDMSAALRRVTTDEPLRASLVDRGLARAASFSWEECAVRLVDVAREALAEREGPKRGT